MTHNLPIPARLLEAAVYCVVAGCVAAAAPERGVSFPGVDRGAHVAQRDCAACHAVEADGPSPNPAAPSFGQVSLRYNPIALEQALGDIAAHGHFEMPPHAIRETDVADLAAYIGSLDKH